MSSLEDLLQEYYELFHTVNQFDQRAMVVKGWGVTLSLAALVGGFQYGHYGLFLVASLSGFTFWILEGVMKRHQMRYYFRMREIEVLRYKNASERDLGEFSSPRIDSSWTHAGEVFSKGKPSKYHPEEMHGPRISYRFVWLYPHVSLPHCVSVVAGIVLLWLAKMGAFGRFMW